MSGREAPTYTARFTPQAWANDYAIDVDPEGEQEWTVSEGMTEDAARIVDTDAFGIDADDVLKGDGAAPEWVREWHGPFTIHVRKDCAEPRCDADMSTIMCPNDRRYCLDHCGDEDH